MEEGEGKEDLEEGTGARVATLGATMAMGARGATLEVAMGTGARGATMAMGAKVVTLEVAMGARVATLEEEVTALGEAAMAMVAKVGLMEATTGIVSEEVATMGMGVRVGTTGTALGETATMETGVEVEIEDNIDLPFVSSLNPLHPVNHEIYICLPMHSNILG